MANIPEPRDVRLDCGCILSPLIGESLELLVAQKMTFGTIYADPPWQYQNQATRGATKPHYNSMSIKELCALPIRQLAAPNAHLHLWITNAFLFEAPEIFKAWGFAFKSSLVWVKPQMGLGNYWRNSHELLLTAICGDATHFSNRGLKSWFSCARGRHSNKPDQVRDMLVLASPPPRLELFGRRPVHGWTVCGYDVQDELG